MKATELRLGNLINDNAEIVGIIKGIIYVKPIGKHLITSYRYTQLKPILLTQERLKKLGFKKLEARHLTPAFFVNDNMEIEHMEGRKFVIFVRTRKGRKFINLRYVHKLQNLYFELVGIEICTHHLTKTIK